MGAWEEYPGKSARAHAHVSCAYVRAPVGFAVSASQAPTSSQTRGNLRKMSIAHPPRFGSVGGSGRHMVHVHLATVGPINALGTSPFTRSIKVCAIILPSSLILPKPQKSGKYDGLLPSQSREEGRIRAEDHRHRNSAAAMERGARGELPPVSALQALQGALQRSAGQDDVAVASRAGRACHPPRNRSCRSGA